MPQRSKSLSPWPVNYVLATDKGVTRRPPATSRCTMYFAWQMPVNRQRLRIDHDVGDASMSAILLYGVLAMWGSSFALMAYLMRPLPHHDAD
jgi:hypothetical protein